MREIVIADAALLVGPDSDLFIKALKERHGRMAMFPLFLASGLVCVLVTAGLALNGSSWWWLAVGCAVAGASVGGWFVRQRDLERKTVQVDYDLNEHEAQLWTNLGRALERVAACARIWQRTARGYVYDRKRSAGASYVVNRRAIGVHGGDPPYFKSNVRLAVFDLAGQTLYWTPRYVLVYQGRNVGLVRYQDLDVSADTTRFIEEEAVPRDARVVDTTWQYVNKSGDPDRRFANNREIPVCQYGEATLKSTRGLHVELILSRVGAADALGDAVAAIAQYDQTKREQDAASENTGSESIVFFCHSCGTRFDVSPGLAGRSARCKTCDAPLVVPSSSASETAGGR